VRFRTEHRIGPGVCISELCPQEETYSKRKGEDYNRWLGGMRRFAAKLDSPPDSGPR
jgi:hypothetical protein